jgi:hypothetical protein
MSGFLIENKNTGFLLENQLSDTNFFRRHIRIPFNFSSFHLRTLPHPANPAKISRKNRLSNSVLIRRNSGYTQDTFEY